MQATNYLEGVAPSWTSNQVIVLKKSLSDTGLLPIRLPVRETASDGTSAWTLHREVYVIFITVPFAGLTDLLDKLSSVNGPIRLRQSDDLSVELQPVIFPAGFEIQAQSVSYWDDTHSTRTTLQFSSDGKSPQAGDMMAVFQSPAESLKLLDIAKQISSDLIDFELHAMRNGRGLSN